MEFWTYYRIFRKKYRVVAGAVLAAVLFGLGVALIRAQPQGYEATVTLTTTPPDESRYVLVLIGDRREDRPGVYKALAMELIQSRTVAERVVQRLNLDLSPQALRSRVKVRGGTGDLLTLTVTDRDPATAILLANTYAEVAVAYNQEVNRRETALAREFIERELVDTRLRLRRAENALDEFKRQHGIVALDSQVGAEINRYLALTSEQQAADLKDRELAAQIAATRQLLATVSRTKTDTQLAENPVAQSLRGKLVDIEVQLVVARAQYTDEHPAVLALERQKKAIGEALEKEVQKVVSAEFVQINPIYEGTLQSLVSLESQRVALQARRFALARVIPQERRKLPALNAIQREFTRLARDVSVLESANASLEARLNDFRIREQAAMNRNLVYIVDAASSAEPTTRTRLFPRLFVSAMLGLLGGAAIVLFQYYIDNTLKNAKDAERTLKLPVLSSIPRHNPPFEEAYRQLKVSLGLHVNNGAPKAIAFTSPKPGSGTSNVVYYLAQSLARGGKRVIVVDADLRRPMASRLFGTRTEPGLMEVLKGWIPVAQALMDSSIKNIRVLPGGKAVSELTDQFASPAMAQLLAELKQHGDVVLIDTPPAIPFAESQVLASMADGVVFVVAAGQAPRGVEQDAKRQLERVGARILGVVVNKVSPEDDDSYYFHEKYTRPRTQRPPLPSPAVLASLVVAAALVGLTTWAGVRSGALPGWMHQWLGPLWTVLSARL